MTTSKTTKRRLGAGDLVLSDMAPNLSSVPVTDQTEFMYLAELLRNLPGIM